jgi:cytochrome c-type biogenesis protein CcmE
MKPRQQRMLAVGLAVAGVAIAATFTLRAFQDNMMFFVDISDVIAGDYPKQLMAVSSARKVRWISASVSPT